MRLIAPLAVISIFLTSCATIFSGRKAQITVTSPDIRRVDLMVDDIQYENIVLPSEITVRRGFSPSIIMAYADGREGEVVVRKTFNEIGLLNIILGGIPGIIVDCATGAITKPEMGVYAIYLNHDMKPTSGVQISGRSVVGNLPRPIYNVQREGKVVVSITVDQYGNVTQAVPGAEGTTVKDESLWAAARKAAMESHFNKSNDPVPSQGTITYEFKLK